MKYKNQNIPTAFSTQSLLSENASRTFACTKMSWVLCILSTIFINKFDTRRRMEYHYYENPCSFSTEIAAVQTALKYQCAPYYYHFIPVFFFSVFLFVLLCFFLFIYKNIFVCIPTTGYCDLA